jgi:ATP-binding cassette subfamily C (CFTR/MRP) protein 1
MFAPVITIAFYAILATARGSSLDTETAFTTVAILAMVTHPANMMMTIAPRAIAAYASFERIQAYLPGNGRDTRPPSAEHDTVGQPVVSVEKLSVAWDDDGGGKTLQDVSFDLQKGSVTVCSGPVGGGKTTLARAILGEVSPSTGTVAVDTGRVGYCSQTPWLPSKTIKEVIVGQSVTDETWYTRVIRACCLEQDLESLPDGHDTVVGTLGTNLSGGQRQRVALARAVYQRCRLLVLDDTFSALDGKTEQQVITNLLSPDYPHGLLRELGTTVFWITNSQQYFHLADIVLILDKTILEQGPWDKLARRPNISKLIFHDSDHRQHAPDQKPDTAPPIKKTTQTTPNPTKRTGDTTLYAYYFTSAGPASILLMILCTALYSLFNTTPAYLLKIWTSSPPSSTPLYITLYTLLVLAAWIATNGTMISSSLLIAPTSGLTLHKRLLHSIISAPLSYLSSSQGGSVALNRFAEDISLVDKQLAGATHGLSTQVFKLLVQTILLFTVQPVLVLTLPFCSVIVYIVQKIYLLTSRQLRIIELESRSAVAASLLETVQGVETIRAFGWESATSKENVDALDASQRPLYLLLCLQRWLNVVLDLMVAAIAIGTIAVSVVFRGTTTGGAVGVALNVILVANATLLRLVESWTGLEISLGAVARLRDAESLTPREEDGKVGEVLEHWPMLGRVEMENVTGAYR